MLRSARSARVPALSPVVAGFLTPAQFDEAAETIRPGLLQLALLQCQPNDADCCVQDAITNALMQLSRFQVKNESWPSDLAKWLQRILQHCIADLFRIKARRSQGYAGTQEEEREGDLLEHAESLALHDELYHRLETVSLTGLQDACIRRWMGGQTLREIAEELDMSHVMVKYHVDAAAKRLRGREEYDVSSEMHVLFALCSEHTKYIKPTGTWPNWFEQHPPEINVAAWKLRQARKKAVAERKAAQTCQQEQEAER